VQYLDIGGSEGRFLGFFTVLIQASFSYIGTSVPCHAGTAADADT
jgi:amino acid transporter